MTISRFKRLLDTSAVADPIDWRDLFAEFARPVAYAGRDVHPGWSSAEFDPPKRELSNVQRAFAIVFDIDNKLRDGGMVENPITFEAACETWADFFAFVHTTKSHSTAWPRLRVILPLSRPVSKFEFTGLWQRISAIAGNVDQAPKDPSRFWYAPGIEDRPDACYVSQTLTGAFLDPDEWLSKPVPSGAPPFLTEPPGSGPALELENRARAYVQHMPEAISGAGGHTALWSVARRIVCDFGLDEDAAYRVLTTEYNPRCKPPWSEYDLRRKVKEAQQKARVRNRMPDREQVTLPPQQLSAFGATGMPQAAPTENWKRWLRSKQDGWPQKDVGNVALIMMYDPELRGCLEFDLMSYRIRWTDQPGYAVGFTPPQQGSALADHHAVYIQTALATRYQLQVSKEFVWAAIESAAHENEVHPVQDYLSHLQWDGTPRLGAWLHTYLGARNDTYTNTVGRWWLISAVARAFNPGCQADHVLILEGKQGKGKSQAMKALCDPWYLGDMPDIRDSARAADAIGGYWLVEIAELDAIKGAAHTRIKSFVSQQNDVYRAAYAKTPVSRPRSCVFVGTTNESSYLSDPSGARRFWPVTVDNVSLDDLKYNRDQLWAEAVLAYQSGEQWHPDPKHAPMLQREQDERYAEDEWATLIQQFVNSRGDSEFTLADIMTGPLSLEPRFWDRATQTRVGSVLTKLGCEKHRKRVGNGERLNCYKAPLATPVCN